MNKLQRKLPTAGYSHGRTTLFVIEGDGLGGEAPPMECSMMGRVEEAEALNCACEVIVVPPLTWQKKDRSYIKVQLGHSELKFLK
jgi:hypothetical protein